MAGTFALDIRAWCDGAKDKADIIVRKIVLDIFGRVIMRSPVGNPDLWKGHAPVGYVGGRFRNNWYASIGSGSSEAGNKADPNGSASLASVTAAAAGAKAGDVIYLINNLPYSWKLETGWSSQAPAGMVGITVMEFQPLVDKAAQEANQ